MAIDWVGVVVEEEFPNAENGDLFVVAGVAPKENPDDVVGIVSESPLALVVVVEEEGAALPKSGLVGIPVVALPDAGF